MNEQTCDRRNHPSKLILDRMACGDFSGAEKKKLQLHMDHCRECSAYYDAVTDDASRITNRYSQFEHLKKQYLSTERPSTPRAGKTILSLLTPMRGALALGACAVVCMAFYWGMYTGSDPRFSVKGQPQWFLYTKGSLFSTTDKAISVGSGDSLQLLMRISSPVYYHLLYRDDNNPVKRYCCDESKLLKPTDSNKKVSLPFSIALDSLWQRQTLFCIASKEPFDADHAERLVSSRTNEEERKDIWITVFHLYNKANE